jgi:flagellar biosynthesis GTPase FlhF
MPAEAGFVAAPTARNIEHQSAIATLATGLRMSGDDSKKIVEFPQPEIALEERARRLRVDVERLAALPAAEWLFYLESEGVAEKHGISRATMRATIEATVTANEKKAREDKAEDRQREQRAEKKQTAARRESKREQAKQKREQERADKEAERKRKEREKAFEAIAKLPRLAHEARLAELAKRSGEDLDFLRDEFAAYYVPADIDTKPIEPWDQPVDTHALLIELMAHLRRYIVVQDDVAIAITVFMGP